MDRRLPGWINLQAILKLPNRSIPCDVRRQFSRLKCRRGKVVVDIATETTEVVSITVTLRVVLDAEGRIHSRHKGPKGDGETVLSR